MNLQQLQAFVQVAELSSFTRAATALGLAQPLLSRQVRQLEVSLHQTLLLRNGRGVTLTDAGLLLLEHARGILHQVAVAKEAVGASRGSLAGRVSIGLPPSLSKLITVPLSLQFTQKMPAAALTLTEGFSVVMLEALRSGRLDMAVLYNPTPAPDLEMQLLHKEALVLISSQKKGLQSAPAIALRDLAQLPLIAPSRPNAFRLLIESEMAHLNVKPNVVMEIDGLNAILELVKEGLGHAVLPAYTLANYPKRQPFCTQRIERPQLMSQLMLVCSARRPMTATHKAALALTRQVVTQALKN